MELMHSLQDVPLSYANNITIRNCNIECGNYLNVKSDETQYILSDFILENLIINTEDDNYPEAVIDNLSVINVAINKIN